MGIVTFPIDFVESAKSIPCCLDAIPYESKSHTALAAPHLHVRLAKLRCDGNGGDYIGWQEGMEEE